MLEHIAFVHSKGGVCKSTLCEYSERELTRTGKSVCVVNLDQQEHVKTSEEGDIFLYDTAGSFDQSTINLLEAMAQVDNCKIVVPMECGQNCFKELDFIIQTLEKYNVLHKSHFVITKAVMSSSLWKERKQELKDKGVNVMRWVMPYATAFAKGDDTRKTTNEISAFLWEVMGE